MPSGLEANLVSGFNCPIQVAVDKISGFHSLKLLFWLFIADTLTF